MPPAPARPTPYNTRMSYVAVEGVIAVGKTTMARLISERMGMPVLFERFEENPFPKRLSLFIDS